MSDQIPAEGEALESTLGRHIDRLCDRFEAAWRAGRRPRIEDYLAEVSEPVRPALLGELLALELTYRRRAGEPLSRAEYRPRFPQGGKQVEATFDRVGLAAEPAGPRPEGDAGQNLLFGALALQMDFISREALIAATGAWALDKTRPLGRILVEQGALTADERAMLEPLVWRLLERHGGDAERSLAAAGTAASIAEELAGIADPDVQDTLIHVGGTRRADPAVAGPVPAGRSTGTAPRFRVLRSHARGGLGLVSVALDVELNREVAFKQILDRHAEDPESRQRFLVEAEVTGGLEHPGVVPVYGLGVDADGRLYYAMRFIRGDSLKEAIDRFHADEGLKSDPGGRSLALRQFLRRFVDVCNAIDYAHSRGVLHRDIKPSNIIVGKHGETLVVDWGLAKVTGKSDPGTQEQTLLPRSASGSSATLPGSAMGTPAYMSPEQARGDLEHLGPRSDVYSLGATLYGLLTGRPPLEGENVALLLRRAEHAEFPRPRHHDAAIDPALEAVCLKAMALKPEDRYASPRLLADDVERWMADEPVGAWREPWSRRARRWARRHRTTVTAAAVALVAGVVGLSAVLAVQTRAKADLAASNAELTRSKAAVQARYDLAVEAIRTFHTGVSEDFLLREEPFHELRNRLLTSASGFYGKLGALLRNETDATSRRALATSSFELADLTSKVGRKEDALAAHRAVLASREALAAEPGAVPGARVEVGRSLTAIAGLLESIGKTDEALAAYRRSESLLAGLAGAGPSARAALADCRSRLGACLFATGQSAEALAAYQRARNDQEAPAEAPGAPADARRDLSDTVNRIGILLAESGKPSEAEAEFRAALAIRRELADDHPTAAEFRSRLADSHNALGALLSWSPTGTPSAVEAEYRKALGIQQELANDHPAVAQFRNRLAVFHKNLGNLLKLTGRPAEAGAEYREALVLLRKLAADHPAVTDYRNRLAETHHGLGGLLTRTGRPAEAEAEYRKALAIQRTVVDDHPAVTDFRRLLAASHNDLGELLHGLGKLPEAEAAFREALAIQRKVVDDDPTVAVFRDYLGQGHSNLGHLLLQTGRSAEAEVEFRRATALLQKLVDDHPKIAECRQHLTSALTALGDAARTLGRAAESRDAFERAIAAGERLVEGDPTNPSYRRSLASALRRRGLGRHDLLKDPAGAAADARRALGLFDGLPSRSGEEWFETACCRAAIAGLAGVAGSGVPAGEASSEADAAMGLLHKAVRQGYRNADAVRTEPAFEPLRPRPDFRELLMDLAMPDNPFAPDR